jgi:hypothetical protein
LLSAAEVEQFGITIIEAGFFRRDLLDSSNTRWDTSVIADYATESGAKEMWLSYQGTQSGDPARLGEVLIKISGRENPPKRFLAGSNALAIAQADLEARLQKLNAHSEMSKSTDSSFG